jgi:nitroreductase
MEKPATNEFPIHDLLKKRWSPRAFSKQPVAPEILCSLFEAARWSFSCFNDQPWVYLVATKETPEDFERMLSLLIEWNQAWAAAAPVLALSVARTTFHHNGKPNRHALHDVGAASTSLALEATARGLFIHQMGGFDAEKARELYCIPEGWEAVAAMAIGYAGETESLPEKLAQREREERVRKPISEFVMSGAWGQAAPFVRK